MTTRTKPEDEIWELEVAYWEYLKANDLGSYGTLWHDDVIGWPNHKSTPMDKEGIIQIWVDQISLIDINTANIYLKPLSVQIFGDTGMLDQIAILLITIPLLFPLIEKLGFDLIWFGVVMVKTAEIGLVTPPIGMNIFVTSAASGVRLEKVFRGILPFVVGDMIVLALMCFFPQICLWLPNLMSG